MKSLFFWAATLLLVSPVNADGVCYDPNHTPAKSADTVANDMNLIKSHGFDHVRTYISKFGNVNMGQVITQAGMTAALGVPFPAGDTEAQAQAAIDAAKGGGVVYIFVGNENLASTGSVPQEQFDLIARIKSQVPGNVKVGTSQRNTEFLARKVDRWDELVGACDVLGANVHPFFNPGTSADGAIAVLDTQWNQIRARYGGKAILTETGWPSAGSAAGNAGSLAGQQTFFNAYKSWSSSIGSSDKYFFQFFNQDQRTDGLHEQTFGLVSSNGQDKFAMSGSSPQSPPPPQAATNPAATTPEKTTPAATTPEATTPAATTAAPTEKPHVVFDVISHATTTTTSPVASNGTSKDSSSSSTPSPSSSTPSPSSSTPSPSSSTGSNSSSTGSNSSSTDSASLSTESSSSSSSDPTTTSDATASEKPTALGNPVHGTKSDDEKEPAPTKKITTKSSGSSSGMAVTLIIAGAVAACLFGIGFVVVMRRKATQQNEVLLGNKEVFLECDTPARWSTSPKAM